MGRGALTLFPVCAATGGIGRRSRPSLRLGRRPPCGGTAGALRAPAAPPGPAPSAAPCIFPHNPSPSAPASPCASAAPCKPQAYGPQAKPPRRGGFRRASPAAAAAPPTLRPSPPTLRPSPPTLRPSPPTLRPSPPTLAQPPPHPRKFP